MLRRKYFILLSAIAAVLLSTVMASAQIIMISGTVELEKEGGVSEPVVGAVVDLYQVDRNSGSKSDTTDKKGNFRFVGVQPGASFLVAVSGEGLEPVIVPLKSGMVDKIIYARPGDGTRWTEEEVRSATTNKGGGEMSADDKKKLEELEKERAEIEAKNKKAENFNEIINAAIKEGEKAYNDKNYDLAIVKFTEGYEAGPVFLGSAPGFLNSIAISLKERASAGHNTSVGVADKAEKIELRTKAATDFQKALSLFAKSLKLLKNGDPGNSSPAFLQEKKEKAVTQGVEVIRILVQVEYGIEAAKDDAILIAEEYLSVEKDKKKQMQSQLNLGLYLTRVYDFDNSVAAYRKALEMDSEDIDALAGIGLSLYTASEVSGNAGQKQEGLNYMQYYLDKASKDHAYRDSIEGLVEELKGQKMKPQKISKNK